MRAVLAFLRRHKWSLPLAVGATIFFVRLAGETAEGELDPFDAAIAQRVGVLRGTLDGTMRALTTLGGPLGMSLVAASLAGVLVARRRSKELRYATVSAGGALLLNIALKPFFHRARPGAALEYLLPPPTSFSFPSGHAMGSTGVLGATAVVIAVAGLPRRWRVVAFTGAGVLVVGIALSRVYFGVHFPSDVLGGILAGSAWVSAVTGWFYPRLLPGEANRA